MKMLQEDVDLFVEFRFVGETQRDQLFEHIRKHDLTMIGEVGRVDEMRQIERDEKARITNDSIQTLIEIVKRMVEVDGRVQSVEDIHQNIVAQIFEARAHRRSSREREQR